MKVSSLRSVFKFSLFTFVVTTGTAMLLIAATGLILGEVRLNEAQQTNQWLARDIATQFSSASSRFMTMASQFGAMLRSESGGFAASFNDSTKREFDAEDRLRAIWLIDAGATVPVARLEKSGFSLSEGQLSDIRALAENSVKNGSGFQTLTPGIGVIAFKTGEGARTLILFVDEALFSRASGGPRGEKWMLISGDKVIHEAVSENSEMTFPTFAEIGNLIKEENPAGERTEFQSELHAEGRNYQINAVQTGVFGIVALAITPTDASFAFMSDVVVVGVALCALATALAAMFQALRLRKQPPN